MQRAELVAQLTNRQFDLLIIGGGIVGAGIARDAAMRGLSVSLIEQGDFASGTSSKTSKLIHGGLRYLEHGHLSLVFESLRERRALRRIAPNLVQAIPLLLPIYEGNSRAAWKIAIGLRLYALLAFGDRPRSSRVVSAQRALMLEPALTREGLHGAGLYADCQMDDARLCLANILQAVDFGAICCNYVRLKDFMKSSQRICGGIGEDILTGRSFEIKAKIVVNATGPWADGVRRLSNPGAFKRLAPTKGIHLIVRRLTRHGLFVQVRSDGRMFFVLPWGSYTIVGTTESPILDSLDGLQANTDEVNYLLEAANQVLPRSGLREQDVVATYAGARPLLAFSGSASAASREHRIEVDRWGLISIMGGKYTTYRRMAQQTLEFALRRNRLTSSRCNTKRVLLFNTVEPAELGAWNDLVRSLDPDLLARLLARYGTRVVQILELLSGDRSLGQPVCSHHALYTVADLAHAVRNELACSITDLLVRRTRIAWSACQGLDALPIVTDIFRRYGGASRIHLEQQVADYQRFLADSLAFQGHPGNR